MKTISLRFADNYAPKEGTIKLHQNIIDKNGYVWYGKFGNSISQKVIDMLMNMSEKKILLIKSGSVDRYWAYFEEICKDIKKDFISVPEYYRDSANKIKCWFKIIKFEKADVSIMSKFIISSSRMPLSEVSKHSLNPYFVIESKCDEKEVI